MSPEEFSAACQHIVTHAWGDAAHRQLDCLVAELLTGLGYGEGIAIFVDNVRLHHVDLLKEIEAHLSATGISASEFGRRARGDRRFVFDLRKGRTPRRETRERVIAYLKAAAS